MLWFSIPVVILLASIPVLIIVSQIEDFSMRKYLSMYNLVQIYQLSVAGYYAFNKPFSGMFFGTLILAVGTIYLIEQVKEMENS